MVTASPYSVKNACKDNLQMQIDAAELNAFVAAISEENAGAKSKLKIGDW